MAERRVIVQREGEVPRKDKCTHNTYSAQDPVVPRLRLCQNIVSLRRHLCRDSFRQLNSHHQPQSDRGLHVSFSYEWVEVRFFSRSHGHEGIYEIYGGKAKSQNRDEVSWLGSRGVLEICTKIGMEGSRRRMSYKYL